MSFCIYYKVDKMHTKYIHENSRTNLYRYLSRLSVQSFLSFEQEFEEGFVNFCVDWICNFISFCSQKATQNLAQKDLKTEINLVLG